MSYIWVYIWLYIYICDIYDYVWFQTGVQTDIFSLERKVFWICVLLTWRMVSWELHSRGTYVSWKLSFDHKLLTSCCHIWTNPIWGILFSVNKESLEILFMQGKKISTLSYKLCENLKIIYFFYLCEHCEWKWLHTLIQSNQSCVYIKSQSHRICWVGRIPRDVKCTCICTYILYVSVYTHIINSAHVIQKFVKYYKGARLFTLENSVEINYMHYINKCSKELI